MTWSGPNYQAPNLGYWDVKNLYPEAHISLPENMYAPIDMPNVAWSYYGELRRYEDISIGGSRGAHLARTPPLRVPILSFWHTKFSKRNHLGSPHPLLRGPRPPTGNPGSATDIRVKKFSGKINSSLPYDLTKDLRRHYYASISYMDSLVDKVLKVNLCPLVIGIPGMFWWF